MSYETELQARQMTEFAELYTIRCGDLVYYYTSYSSAVTLYGRDYIARPIKRSVLNKTCKLEQEKLSITCPIDPIMQKYVGAAPAESTHLFIVRVFLNINKDMIIIFDGDLIDATFQDNMVTANFESRTKVFRGKIPKFVFQSFCNHDLFDTNCAVMSDSYKVTAQLSAVSGIALTSTKFSEYPNGYFVGGHAKFSLDYRMITSHVGGVIQIQIPFSSSVVPGILLDVWPGCDKSPITCTSKFGNFNNFLGFPNIPSSNPTVWGI